MKWNEQFALSDGELSTEEAIQPVYRNYKEDCEIFIDYDIYQELSQKYTLYSEESQLKDIVFTPKDVQKQTTSNIYFAKLEVKFPRTHS